MRKALHWTTATTYPDAPHEYMLRDQAPKVFDDFRRRIRDEGVTEPFTLRGRTNRYRYFYADGFKYLIVGPVLNRAAVTAVPKTIAAAPPKREEPLRR